MFLSQLSTQQKYNFLDLAVCAALSNDVFIEAEKGVIQQYCVEMQIDNWKMAEKPDLEQVLLQISSNATEQEKRVIALECLALLLIDGDYDEKEQCFAEKLFQSLSISHDEQEKFLSLLKQYLECCMLLSKAVKLS
ncbi:MAG: hypothetical protein ACLTWR_08485 [Agathobaculum desmolans]|uniref:hypothetical protein n=1 Tax=Agathobaculum desmolans TaxID=39484 RepID=UPI0004E21C69|nr:hypothetical protein [Agathobaculum desmolans]